MTVVSLISFAVGLCAVFGVFRMTRLRSFGAEKVKAERGPPKLEATDAMAALGLCALAQLILEVAPHHQIGAGSLGIVSVVLALAVAGAVWAPDATTKVLGVVGLLAFLAGSLLPQSQGVTVLVAGMAIGYLVACATLRRRFE